MNNLFMILAAIYIAGIDAQFFHDRKPCKYEDSECSTEVFDCLMQEMLEGVNSWNDEENKYPYGYVMEIKWQPCQGRLITIDLRLSHNLIYGFKDAVVSKVKGFDKDLKQKHEVAIKVKNFGMIADYSIDGMLLKPPISGTGECNITFINADLEIMFSGTPHKANGQTFMKIDNVTVDIKYESLEYNFSNLFKGRIEISDGHQQCRCEEVRHVVARYTSELYGTLIKDYITNVTKKCISKLSFF